MVNTEYFKNKIMDELEGAKCYIMNALELKSSHLSWAKTLFDMASIEMAHAANLYRMYEEYYTELQTAYDTMPDYLEECHTEMVTRYAKCVSKLRYMQELYSR